MMEDIFKFWEEGTKYGFPPCCKARFILSRVRPRFFRHRIAPGFFARINQHYGFRRALADGMVPCEYHALKYLLTGDKTSWRKRDMRPDICCETRRDLEDAGIAVVKKHKLKASDVDEGQDLLADSVFWIWLLHLPVVEGEGGGEHSISVHNCPWCGSPLG